MNKSAVQLSATIGVTFNGPMALTQYSLQVVNTGVCAVEALYHFALPRSSSLMKCNVMMEGHTFVGQVLPRSDASDVHEEAVESGERSVLLESMNDGVYGLNVGNLDAGESLTIEMTIASLLTVSDEGRTLTYRLPTTIAPRYGETGNDVEPEYSFFAQYPFTASVILPINGQAQSCSHPRSANMGTIELQGQLDRDIFISWQQEACNQLYSASYRGHSYTLGFPILPAFGDKAVASPGQLLHVVLDRSGSMAGASIQLCKQALSDVVRGLNEATAFNLTSFGCEHHTLFTHKVAMNAQHSARCLKELALMDADMGGTELISALLHAISHNVGQRDDDGLVKQLLLITDGQVHLNDDEVAAVQLGCQKQRVHLHIIGVGYNVNTHALVQLANVTHGSLHIVNPNGEMKTAIQNILQILHSAAQPVSLVFEDEDNNHTLSDESWSSAGTMWYANLPQAVYGQGERLLKHEASQRQWRPNHVEGEWAQALVHIAAAQHIHGLDRQSATQLALDLGMLSLYTSVVMLDTSNHVVTSSPVPVVVPQMLSADMRFRISLPDSMQSVACDMGDMTDNDPSQDYFSLSHYTLLSVDELGSALLEDMKGRWWRKSRWTRQYLTELGVGSERLKEFQRLASEAGVALDVIAIAFVLAYIHVHADVVHNAALFTPRVTRRLARLSPKVDEKVKRKVTAYYRQEVTDTSSSVE